MTSLSKIACAMGLEMAQKWRNRGACFVTVQMPSCNALESQLRFPEAHHMSRLQFGLGQTCYLEGFFYCTGVRREQILHSRG